MHPPNARTAAGHINLLAICLCFFLSGVAALAYQIAWMRQFALVFGTSELATAAVLAAYMGGLALGAGLIERHIGRVRRPVHWYAGLELCIAVSALTLVPAGLWLAEQGLVVMFGGQAAPPAAMPGGTSLYYLMAAFLILLVPTTLMGATLPLLARHAVEDERDIGLHVGLLYACNTSGAVVGALLGALLLLPALGLAGTTWIAAAINLLVAGLALALSRHEASRATGLGDHPPGVAPPLERLRAGASAAWVLPLMLLSGAVSFLHEVLWTRMLSHILGSSVFAFGVMLGSFLAGIALGGGLGAVLARRRETAARWLAVSELAVALAAVGAWYAIQQMGEDIGSLAQRIGFGLALLFPLACAIGLTYPLAVRVLASGVDDAARASARVYSWNTVGAILGAIAGGFLVVPALRYEGSVQLAVVGSCVLAGASCLLLFRTGLRFSIPVTLAGLAVALLFVPAAPEALLRFSPLRVARKGELLYYDVGRSAAVVALRLGDQISLRTNGLPDAAIEMRGTAPQLYAEAWMTPLAVLSRPQLQDMLVVGLGAGRVLEAVPPSVRRIDVIELESKVIDANRRLAPYRARDPLGDARVRLIVNDARGALRLTGKKYDAVISQPSHPWTAGASHLYTREFMLQSKAHLNPGGLFVQWMNIDFLDESLLRSLVATIHSVFPHVRLYRPTAPTLIFLASDAPIEPERQVAATGAALAAASGQYGRLGLNVVEDLVASLAMDESGCRAFAAGAPIISDDTNRFAVVSVFDTGRNLSAGQLGLLLAPHDPLLRPDGFIRRELQAQLDFGYVARRIQAFAPFDGSSRSRLVQLADQLGEADLQVYVRSLARHDAPRASAAQRTRVADAAAYPGSALLRDAALEGRLADLSFGAGPELGGLLAGVPIADDNAVLRAARLAARDDWAGVAALDPALSEVPLTSLWIGQAVRLRVMWRVRDIDPASRSRRDAESVAMIDRLNVFRPDPRLFLLRVESAGTDGHVLLESMFRYTLLVLQGEWNPDAEARRSFGALQARFAGLRFDDPVDQHHLAEVQSTVAAVAALPGQ